jgi:hypothetical protein
MSIIFGFVYKYFFDAIIVFAVGMFSKALIKQFGNDRAVKIKETILAGMLWAEEKIGIGSGTQKWTEAWQKIITLLKDQGIVLKEKEISYVQDLMKANIPEINAITYSSCPEEVLKIRQIKGLSLTSKGLIEKLKKKYPVSKE